MSFFGVFAIETNFSQIEHKFFFQSKLLNTPTFILAIIETMNFQTILIQTVIQTQHNNIYIYIYKINKSHQCVQFG